MNRKIARIIGAVLLLAAAVFVAFALGHPEMSFPWSNTVTYALYAAYAAVTLILLAAPFQKKPS